MTKDTFTVAALGDIHIHETNRGYLHPLFTQISEEADILVICGDITNSGTREEAEMAVAEFKSLRIPIVAVLGNHDHHAGQAQEIKKVLAGANVTFLDDEIFVFHDVGFAGIKGFGGGFDSRMLSAFGEDATKFFVQEAVNECLKLETQLRALTTKKIFVALHYSPIAATVKGEPEEIFPFLGCSRIAETIDRYPVTAVFHGHAHHGIAEGATKNGIPVFNCAHDVMKAHHPKKPYALFTIQSTKIQPAL